jgi:hypothetical protein
VKETPAAFERRTGLRYEPLPGGGRPLRPREACPTLFRYPGPEGLRDFLHGTLRRLAPPGSGGVWLSSDPRARAGQPRAVALFGSVAVLEPLRLSPCAAPGKGLYLGANVPLPGLPGVVWIPPAMIEAGERWDRLRADDLLNRSGYERERASGLERLNLYLEELDALRRAGAEPRQPWCSVPEPARRAMLRRHGVRPLWTVA